MLKIMLESKGDCGIWDLTPPYKNMFVLVGLCNIGVHSDHMTMYLHFLCVCDYQEGFMYIHLLVPSIIYEKCTVNVCNTAELNLLLFL